MFVIMAVTYCRDHEIYCFALKEGEEGYYEKWERLEREYLAELEQERKEKEA